MHIDDRFVSIKLYKLKDGLEINSIINDIEYPLTTDNYTYGLYNKVQMNERVFFNFVCSYNSKFKQLSDENGNVSIKENPIQLSTFGKVSIIDDKLEMINCDNLIKALLENEFGKGYLEKVLVPDENYSKIYDECFVKTSGTYMVHSKYRDYKVNIKSDELNDSDLEGLFENSILDSTSFNGKMMMNRELSFKLNKNGNILFYNSPKNPLEWNDVYKFLDEYVY